MKASEAEPVRPWALVSLPTTVCAPSASPVSVNDQVPFAFCRGSIGNCRAIDGEMHGRVGI